MNEDIKGDSDYVRVGYTASTGSESLGHDSAVNASCSRCDMDYSMISKEEGFFYRRYHHGRTMHLSVDVESFLVSMCSDSLASLIGYNDHYCMMKLPSECLFKGESVKEINERCGILEDGVSANATLKALDGQLVPVSMFLSRDTLSEVILCEIVPVGTLKDSTSPASVYYLNDVSNTEVKLNLLPEANDPSEICGLLSTRLADGIWDLNMMTNYEYLSPRFKEILGYEDSEMENSPIAWQKLLFPEDAALCQEMLQKHLTEKTQFNPVLRFTHKLGHTVWVICRGLALKNAKGEFVRMIGTHTDLTEIKTAELRLKETIELMECANVRAVEASHAKSVFLANISHEIRTPLNSINGLTEILLSSKHLPQEEQSLVKIISTSGNALMELINDILDFSKLEAGKLAFNFEYFSLDEFFETTLGMFTIPASEKDIVLSYKGDENLPKYIESDHLRLRQVLINLIGNSLKFTAVGSVQVVAAMDGQCLTISVKDSGVGIPESVIDSLGKPFVQAHDKEPIASVVKGTGLGLSICKSIVEQLGGAFLLSSTEGDGCNVELSIPVKTTNELKGDILTRNVSIEVASIETMGKAFPLKILVVDDNAYNRKVLQLMLKKMSYTCDLAENGLESVAKYKEVRYDVIFMDVQMPVMDGFQATEAILGLYPSKRECPLIVLSYSHGYRRG